MELPEDEFKKIMRKWEEIRKSVKELIDEEIKRINEEVQGFKSLMQPSWSSDGVLKPLYTLKEAGNEYIVYIDLPRADEGSINVEFVNNRIILKASLKKEVRFKDWSGVGSETSFREYQGVIELPIKIDPQKVKVRTKKGIVEIRIPKQ